MAGETQNGVMTAIHLTDDAVEPYYLLHPTKVVKQIGIVAVKIYFCTSCFISDVMRDAIARRKGNIDLGGVRR
jgi:hypothetical protein